ncbi:hypothetical protein NP233_g3450 [Leucocoprinus birnbaumii]|uniref:Uncharacterized protein n=1 Tax=Leucocoprinus birnbaumii TaxID=56174 RepID=A0AAD5VZ34_9AGAR|nr:hypothetical protein NP233_g3450 [Leucocoprinus birnbaumii]
MPRLGLLEYVNTTTLPRIRETPDMPRMPLPGHRSNKNHLTVRSEEWRRLELLYQIDPTGFAHQVNNWASFNIRNIPFQHADAQSAERLSLGTRRRDGLSDYLDHPMDSIDRLAAFLDILPLRTAQRLIHILFPDTRQWRFKHQDELDVDRKIFNYFLWTKTQRGSQNAQNALVIAYQPPWVLGQVDFEEFVKCGSLWDTCVKNNTKWFVITSWNVWAFGCFSDGWCSAVISDIWHLDEHTPNVLECLTYWIASAMGRSGAYRKPKVPEPLNALQAEIELPITQAETVTPAVSESNWKGKSQDAATSAHLPTLPPSVSHQGIEDDEPIPPIKRDKPTPNDSILEWRDSVIDIDEDSSHRQEEITVFDREIHAMDLHGEWLI